MQVCCEGALTKDSRGHLGCGLRVVPHVGDQSDPGAVSETGTADRGLSVVGDVF